MGGLLRGTLELDSARGCVLLSGKPVVWPAETTLTTDPPEVHLPSGLTARSGDLITGGGGEVPATAIRETGLRIEGDLTTALGCAGADSKVAVLTTRGDDISVFSGDRDRLPPCRSSQLRARIYLQGATGTLVGPIRVINGSPSPCVLRGRPRMTLERIDGHPIRVAQGRAPPLWRLQGRKPPQGWPVVRLPPDGQAQTMIVFRNWCGRPDRRITFNLHLPAGGELVAEKRIRLRCDVPGEPVSLGVGPFEPHP
jgi:hypothetical protein